MEAKTEARMDGSFDVRGRHCTCENAPPHFSTAPGNYVIGRPEMLEISFEMARAHGLPRSSSGGPSVHNPNPVKRVLYAATASGVAAFVMLSGSLVSAQSGVIRGCVGNDGKISVVGPTGSCKNNESVLT